MLLTGAGRAFVAGADIAELAEQTPSQAQGARRARPATSSAGSRQSPKPMIAAVNGFALGGGCELAMACHIRIASDAAKFGQPEVKLGIVPGYGGTQRLPRLVGKGRALQLLLTGEMIDAAEAYRIGLVNRVVPGARAARGRPRDARRRCSRNGPLAVALVHRGGRSRLRDAARRRASILEANHFGLLAATRRTWREGMRAFLEKRPREVQADSDRQCDRRRLG